MTRFEDPLRVKYGQLDVTDHPYIFASDADFGAGENLYEALAGLLSDGESVTSTRTSNREFSFGVWVEAPTLEQIEDPETALIAEAERPRNELTVWPGDGGTPFVLETFRAQVEHERTDSRERAGMRRFVLTVKALPFARSVNPTLSEVMAAPPPPATPIIMDVDACDSTAGWTAHPSPIASTGGFVYNPAWAYAGDPVELKRDGGFDVTSTPYLVVEWYRQRPGWSPIWEPPIAVFSDPRSYYPREPIQTVVLGEAGWAQSVYDLSGIGAFTEVAFTAMPPTVRSDHRMHIRNIDRTDQIPAPRATGHQLSRTIEVGGSARTQASLHLWHDDAPLGDVLMHTSSTSEGMFSCEPFLVGDGTPAAGMVTSTEKALDAGRIWNVPASMFNPAAPGREVIARLRRPGTGPITVTVQPMRDTLGDVIPVGDPEVQTFAPPATATMKFISLGVFNMPPRRVDGVDAVMKVTVQGAGAVLDDLWFVDIETGSLTWVDGIEVFHLWADSPTVNEPLPRVRTAIDVEGRGGVEVDPVSMGRHDFPPGPLHIYTVSTGAESSSIQLEYFKRWRTHARE